VVEHQARPDHHRFQEKQAMAEHAHITGGERPLPLQLIDLDSHADGALMQMCARGIALQDLCRFKHIDRYVPGTAEARELWGLTKTIMFTKALSIEGLRMKAMFAIGDEWDIGKVSVAEGPAVSVIYDAVRLGVFL
jgi:hypothetical protein